MKDVHFEKESERSVVASSRRMWYHHCESGSSVNVGSLGIKKEIEEGGVQMGRKKKDWEQWEPQIKVHCKKCDKWMDEALTVFIDISEGMQGEDRMTFRCPICKTVSTSTRVK